MSAFFYQMSLCEFKRYFTFWDEDKKWWNRNTEDALWGSGVGSTILRSTLLKRGILDKLKGVFFLKSSRLIILEKYHFENSSLTKKMKRVLFEKNSLMINSKEYSFEKSSILIT